MIAPSTVAALISVCARLPIFPRPAPGAPAVQMRSVPGETDKFVGSGGDNVREDVRDTMDRLHMLWALSNSDYDAEYPAVSAQPLGSTIPTSLIPLTIAAIGRNVAPTLHPAVAQHFLNLTLVDTVGRQQANQKGDILLLQNALVTLPLLGASARAAVAAERTAVQALTTPAVPDARIPETLSALSRLKDALAGGRLGWAPIHADEGEAGTDRFAGQTFDFTVSTLCHFPAESGPPPTPARTVTDSFGVSIFVPRGAKPGVNKVHVFFSPGDVTGDHGLNAVLTHGLRGSSDSSEWILISVPGIANGWRTIDLASIQACLSFLGRPGTVTDLRLSAHSRGASGLRESLSRGFLRQAIDRITVLDASDAFRAVPVAGALRAGGATARQVIAYGVNTGNLAGAVNIRLDPFCVRAIGYTRLIRDAFMTRIVWSLRHASEPLLTIPPAIDSQLLPLPSRGGFTTSAAPGGGQVSIAAFCTLHRSRIATIVGQENTPGRGLLDFIKQNDLVRFGAFRLSFGPGIYSHHLFVAEIAHELTN
jgi:hypothetical protein